MQIYRLFLNAPLAANASISLNDSQAHYVRNVLRLKLDDALLVFNGVDGEWQAKIAEISKKHVSIIAREQTRAQTPLGTIDVYFAPLKARLEYSVQKQVEMGARSITPVKTQHTQMPHVNMDKLQGYIHEATEQCGILSLPELKPLQNLRDILGNWPAGNVLIFCDEAAPVANPLEALKAIPKGQSIALLIGPEGGFSEDERKILRAHPHVLPIALGPRILRADTALVAAMAVIQSVVGDW